MKVSSAMRVGVAIRLAASGVASFLDETWSRVRGAGEEGATMLEYAVIAAVGLALAVGLMVVVGTAVHGYSAQITGPSGGTGTTLSGGVGG